MESFLKTFLFNFFSHFSMCVLLLLLLLLYKTLVLRNYFIKYNHVHTLCFIIRYLHLHLSLNFSIYSLVKYHMYFYLVFT